LERLKGSKSWLFFLWSSPIFSFPCPLVLLKIEILSQAPVAHSCNPSYSGGRDQEDHGSKIALANGLQDPILKKPITKKAGEWIK
jgi:hypothetical protein